MLNSFENFYGYDATVVKTMYDSAGAVITTGVPDKIEWVATIVRVRSALHSSQTFIIAPSLTGTSPAVTYTKVQEHSPAVNGTYTLSLNNILVSYWDTKTNSINT